MNDLSATDLCVKCGLCLPHCPTFAISGNEADSPRGRLTLMHSLDQPEPVVSPGLFTHLDNCTQCRACEAMCPSKVPFAELMDTAQLRLQTLRKTSRVQRLMKAAGLRMLASPAWLNTIARLLQAWQITGLQRLSETMPGIPGRLRRLLRLIPEKQGLLSVEKTPVEATATVQLFLGCVGKVLDKQTLQASCILLQGQGFKVETPATQNCCGAVHLHNASADMARKLATSNIRAFARTAPVISCASGCSAHLLEYGKQSELQGALQFSRRVTDILHFLLKQGPENLEFNPLRQDVAVYLPCTHRNVLRQQQDVETILGWIPGIRPQIVNPDGGCCGAAGSYMLSQPEMSDKLQEQVITKIAAMNIKMLVTSNIGCSLQIRAGLKKQGLEIEVLHPAVLLARQLRD